MDEKLEAGIAHLQKQRTHLNWTHGILVTRTSATEFTLEIHSDVPFGITREKHDW